MHQESQKLIQPGVLALCALYFVSGIPALIYQLAWQRALYRWVGLNIESVTLVVTLFILGLGVGALIGGYLTRLKVSSLLLVFAAAELLIGVAGVISLTAIDQVGLLTLHSSALGIAFAVFFLLLGPTLLMGATLPILSAYLIARIGNVGKSIGLLYFFNTLGAAFACFLTGLVLMRSLGLAGTVNVAAILNLLVAASVLLVWIFSKQQKNRTLTAQEKKSDPARFTSTVQPRYLAVAAIMGYISLSFQIIWVRLHMFTTGSSAWAFAFVLGGFLSGIAAGSLIVGLLCSRGHRPSDAAVALLILIGGVVSLMVAPLSARLLISFGYPPMIIPIAGASTIMGAVFPLVSHIAIDPGKEAGRRIGVLYLSNIIGSVAGALITGYLLLDILSMKALSLLLVGVAIVFAWFFWGREEKLVKLALFASAITTTFIFAPHYSSLYERLQYKNKVIFHAPFSQVVENRSGVITVEDGETIYGGGMYDGKFNVDLIHDSNQIVRAYSLGFLSAKPSRVLMIGLGSGSWGQVIVNHPDVKELIIVEINPGYETIVKENSIVSSLLQNKKVQLVSDDGRRWLTRNPGETFDAIVMNTTYHWRSHASSLLSREFLNLISDRLRPGGIAFYNATGSKRAMFTACSMFPTGYRVHNFIAVANDSLDVDVDRWRRNLLDYRIDDRAVIDSSRRDHMTKLNNILYMAHEIVRPQTQRKTIEGCEGLLQRIGKQRVITDDNMGSEWDLKRRWH